MFELEINFETLGESMKLKFDHKGNEIEFSVIRKKRKTISIKIEENGEIVVGAPLKISSEYILLVVKNKIAWIIDKQEELELRDTRRVKRDFIQDSTFMYLGEEYPFRLVFEERRKNILIELCDEFKIYTNTFDVEKLKIELEKWYRAETFKIVTRRINYYSNNFKDKVTAIKVKEQKRRWASCTGKNAILFNWRISMARVDIIDYIVVHEMCHMDYRDHSKHFWNRVAEIMPDYKEKHEWLKLNGMNLFI